MNKLIAIFSSTRMTTSVAFAATLTVALLSSVAASAQAPSGSTDISGPTAVDARDAIAYAITYGVTGSDVTSSTLTVALPIGVSDVNAFAPSGVTSVCTGVPATGITCVFDLNFTSGGVSGQATIGCQLERGYQLDGATMTATATLEAAGVGGTMTPVVDTQDTEVSADAVPIVQTKKVINPRWMINPNPEAGKSDVGISWQYEIRTGNVGNAWIDADWTLTNDIDDVLTFVDWTPVSAGLLEVSALTAWTKGDLTLTTNEIIPQVILGALVRVWISCTDLPLVPGMVTNQLDFSGTEQKSAGPVTVTATESSTRMPEEVEGACGTGGRIEKASNPLHNIGEGEDLVWGIGVAPPNGALEVSDAFIVDRLPADTTFVSATAGSPAEFTLYYCDVPAEAGNFTASQFLGVMGVGGYQSANCSTAVPSDLSTVTHVAWYSATWGDATVGIDGFSAQIVTAIPIGVHNDGDKVTNTAQAEGAYAFSGITTFLFAATDDVAVRTLARGLITVSQNASNTTPKVVGQELIIYAWAASDWEYARLRNPTVTMTLPPELQVIEIEAPGFNGGACSWDGPLPAVYTDPPASQILGDGSTELTWTFGSGAQPTLMGFDCPGSASRKPLWLPVRVRVDPFADLTNGQILTYSATIDGENIEFPQAANNSVPIAVPAEMRTDVEPDCTADTEPLPSLLVRYENTGGVELTNVVVTAAIPKVGDGSGTQVDTLFVRTENVPAGSSIEYQVGGSWQSASPGDLSTITAVRLLQPSLGTFTGSQAFNVVLSVPGVTPTGTFIRGSSMLDAAPLTQVASANSAPIRVNLCPGVLAVHVFFDPNNNGVQDGGEPDLPSYDVVTTDTGDASVVLNWTTDATGDYSQQVAPATYELTVTHPTVGAGATWTSSPVQATAVTGQTVLALIPVTTCEASGDCTNVTISKVTTHHPELGEDATFELTVTNAGTNDGLDVQVVDTLPAGWVAVGATTFDIGTLAVGESTVRVVTATPPEGCDNLGDYVNQAVVTASNDDDPTDNSTSSDVTVGPPTGVIDLCDGTDNNCDGTDGEDEVCDDGHACTTGSCDQTTAACTNDTTDDSACDDGDPCTNDTCDPVLGCQADPYVSTQVACGVGPCASIFGDTACDPATGTITDNCDTLIAVGIVETCDGIDEDCDGIIDNHFDVSCDPGILFYAVVEKPDGTPYGTVRCFQQGANVACTPRDDDPNKAKIFPGLMCPGAQQ